MEDFLWWIWLWFILAMVICWIVMAIAQPKTYQQWYCKALQSIYHDVWCVKDDKIIYKFK